MKKTRSFLSLLLVLTMLCPAALAAEPAGKSAAPVSYSLKVNGQTPDLSDLPRPIYEEDGSVMIPLRKTAEALGLTVAWRADLHAAQVEDSVQSALVQDGSAAADFTGKLTVINLTREETMPAAARIFQGYTYVPASYFEWFFNDVTVSGTAVSVDPIVYYLDNAGT